VGEISLAEDRDVAGLTPTPDRTVRMAETGDCALHAAAFSPVVALGPFASSLQRSCGCGGTGTCTCGEEDDVTSPPLQRALSDGALYFSPTSLLSLQRLVGNHAASSLVSQRAGAKERQPAVPRHRGNATPKTNTRFDGSSPLSSPVQRNALDEFLARGQAPPGTSGTGTTSTGPSLGGDGTSAANGPQTGPAVAGGAAASSGQGPGPPSPGVVGDGGTPPPSGDQGGQSQGGTPGSASSATTVAGSAAAASGTGGGDTDTIAGTIDSAIGAVGGGISSAVSWAESEIGKAALSAVSWMASSFGATVTVVGTEIHVDIPDIPLFDAEQSPIVELPRGVLPLPLAVAGAGPCEVALLAELAVQCRADGVLGPGAVRNIHLVIDAVRGTGSATGQLHVAASAASAVAPEAGLSGEGACIIPAGEVPIPIEADVFGGVRLTLQVTGLGNLDETVTLSYAGGALTLDANTTLKLGARFDASLDAVAELNVEDLTVCEYEWPIASVEIAEQAEQFDFPITVGYSSSGPSFSAGTPTSKPIPLSDIEAVLPEWLSVQGCKPLDEVISYLCTKHVLPPSVCTPTGPGPLGPSGPPVGPVPFGPTGPGGGGGGTPPTGEFPITYRGGSAGRKNLTPRKGADDGGLSTFEALDAAAKPGDKAQQIDTRSLSSLVAAQDPPPPLHVSVYPGTRGSIDRAKMAEWQDSRDKDSEPEHPLTIELRNAILKEVKRPKT
jgi:hypothetical protein